jgi:hypothetical protein
MQQAQLVRCARRPDAQCMASTSYDASACIGMIDVQIQARIMRDARTMMHGHGGDGSGDSLVISSVPGS